MEQIDPMTRPLPIIEPFNWPGLEQSVHRSLCFLPKEAGTPWLAFYYELPTMKAYIGPRRLEIINQTPLELEKEAIKNLTETKATWTPGKLTMPSGKEIEVLRHIGPPDACERILDREFMKEGQKMLDSGSIAVIIPQRGMLIATILGNVRDIMKVATANFEGGKNEPITPWAFFVENGIICGRFFLENDQVGIDAVVAPEEFLT